MSDVDPERESAHELANDEHDAETIFQDGRPEFVDDGDLRRAHQHLKEASERIERAREALEGDLPRIEGTPNTGFAHWFKEGEYGVNMARRQVMKEYRGRQYDETNYRGEDFDGKRAIGGALDGCEYE